jgi:plastocyanin
MARKAFRLLLMALAGLATACSSVSTFAGGNAVSIGATHIVELNLTKNHPISTPYGESGGIRPAVLTVRVGDTIVFMNSDTFGHTSSSLGNFKRFPAASPLAVEALTQHGTTLSGGWSSGSISPGSSSQKILADKAGTYLYGCFFHYNAPMRATIVAK